MTATPPADPGGQPASGAADPSMEDILASIRRILSEDEAAPAPEAAEPAAAPPPAEPAPAAAPPPVDSDVLALDASMLVAELPPPPRPAPSRKEPALPEPAAAPFAFEPATAGLVGPEAAASAAVSVGSLVRTLAEHHAMSVYRGGPTLEDIVRDEMRPMLKAWLDENLPPLVERLVRAEIDRVVSRAVS